MKLGRLSGRLLVAAGLGVVALVAARDAGAVVLAYEAQTPQGPANCFPFGMGFAMPTYIGFVYRDIPAFTVNAGDAIAFDLGLPNDANIILDLAMATTSVNGGDVPAGNFVTVVSNGTPLVPRGDAINDNFELAFPIQNTFSHGGGGLVIRFLSKGAFTSDTTCTGVLRSASSTDGSGHFVKRFWNDPDGVFPWSSEGTTDIGPFRIGLDDLDVDGAENNVDVCPEVADPLQEDFDTDGDGDACDDDDDDDTILDVHEPGTDAGGVPHRTNLDSDGDGVPDAIEAGDTDPMTVPVDTDGDSIPDFLDLDSDDDGVLDEVDVCRILKDPQQIDSDGDGVGDACTNDDDGDGVLDPVDNCPGVANPDQLDTDDDGEGDACDGDVDGDGVANELDNCPLVVNANQADYDGDGEGDACDDTPQGGTGGGGQGGSGSTTSTSGAGGAGGGGDDASDGGGCGCVVVGASEPATRGLGAGLVLALGSALLARRRRRR